MFADIFLGALTIMGIVSITQERYCNFSLWSYFILIYLHQISKKIYIYFHFCSSLTNEALAHHDTRHHDLPSTGTIRAQLKLSFVPEKTWIILNIKILFSGVYAVAKYEIEERGSLYTLDYRCYFSECIKKYFSHSFYFFFHFFWSNDLLTLIKTDVTLMCFWRVLICPSHDKALNSAPYSCQRGNYCFSGVISDQAMFW